MAVEGPHGGAQVPDLRGAAPTALGGLAAGQVECRRFSSNQLVMLIMFIKTAFSFGILDDFEPNKFDWKCVLWQPQS